MSQRRLFAILLFLVAGQVTLLRAQCVNMTSLDSRGTYYACANHEWEHLEDGTNWYAWKWYDNSKEDYGITGYNNRGYNMQNVLCTRQTVISTPGSDYLQPALSMLPPGEKTSIRLGNPRAGGKGTRPVSNAGYRYSEWHPQAEAVYFDYYVDPASAILQFEYAAVMAKPTHYYTNDDIAHYRTPHINVYVTDVAGNKLNTSTLSFVKGGDKPPFNEPDWKRFTLAGTYNHYCYWKDWSTTGFDLSAYIGQTVRLRVENYDCVLYSPQASNFTYCDEDFSYLYFFVHCAEKVIEEECLEGQKAQLTAPEGFNYKWYVKGKESVVLGTSCTLDVTKADGRTTYCCRLTQKDGMGGNFVLESTPRCNPITYISETICGGTPYVFNGQSLTKSGIYEQVFHLAGGVDSTVYLDLVVNELKEFPTENVNLCQGHYYAWPNHGSRYAHITQAGDYYDTIRYVASGCDSARYHLNVKVVETLYSTDHVSYCASALSRGFIWHGMPIFKLEHTGQTARLTSVNGCDSVVTLDLKVVENMIGYDTIIKNTPDFEPFDWNGYTIWDASDDGMKADGGLSQIGCDSIVVLRLIIAKDSLEPISLCDNELPYLWRGQTIYGMQNNGIRVSEKDKDGKDSIFYTLDLHVLPTHHTIVDTTICQGDGYLLGDELITRTGHYSRHLRNQYDCDSLVDLTLTVQTLVGEFISREDICEGEEFAWIGHGEKFAHLTQTDEYNDTIRYTTGCDSAYYTLKLYMHSKQSAVVELRDTICAGDSLYFFDRFIRTQGRHEATISTQFGCDSTIATYLLVAQPTYSTVNDILCEGSSYSWVGHGAKFQNLTQPDTYRDTLLNAMGCDSVVTLVLTQGTTIHKILRDTICGGETITLGDTTISTSGHYLKHLAAIHGCDSLIELYLTVQNPVGSFSKHDTICEGDFYTWDKHGERFANLTQADEYKDTLRYTTGCDSAYYTLYLHVHAKSNIVEEKDTICQGDSLYFVDRYIRSAGRYESVVPDQFGCDSTVAILLYVAQHTSSTHEASFCEGNTYTWVGHGDAFRDIATSGTYKDTIPNAMGCDSVMILTLTQSEEVHETTYQTICEGGSFAFADSVFATAGTHVRTIQHEGVCDSVLTLVLTVNPIRYGDDTLHVKKEELPRLWNGLTLTSSADNGKQVTLTHPATGCDSVVTLHLFVHAVKDSVEYDTICSSTTSYSWHNQAITIDGRADMELADTLRDKYKYDSIRTTLYLHTILTEQKEVNRSYCHTTEPITISESVLWDGQEIYVDTTITYDGSATQDFVLCYPKQGDCVSKVSFHVIFYPTYSDTIRRTICENQLDTFRWHGYGFSSLHPQATYRTTSTHGCDSLETMVLTILPVSRDTVDITICPNSSYTFFGQVLTKEGVYTDTTNNYLGCDSIVTLRLSISDKIRIPKNESICPGGAYEFAGQMLSEAGTYYDTIPGQGDDCDSIIVLTLSVRPLTQQSQHFTICDGDEYTFGMQILSEEGTYYDTLPGKLGECDTVVTLDLVVQKADTLPTDSVYVRSDRPYTWVGHGEKFANLTEAGLYQDTARYHLTGCDSAYQSLYISTYEPLLVNMFADTMCADDQWLNLHLQVASGAPVKYEVQYKDRALQYFENTNDTITETGSHLIVSLPVIPYEDSTQYIRPDVYSLSMRLIDEMDEDTVIETNFMVFYPSWLILQRWNDVLMLQNENYNGGYLFSQIRWYHNGKEITGQGEHNSYTYHNGALQYGEKYWAELTRSDDNRTIRTCDFVPEEMENVTIFQPVIAMSPRHIGNLHIVQVESNISGDYTVYDAAGKHIQNGHFGEEYGSPDIVLPMHGTYIIRFVGNEGTIEIKKWLAD